MAYKLKLTKLAYLSSVDVPAQGDGAQALLLKRDPGEFSLTARVVKQSDELGLVFGHAFATSLDGGKTPHVDVQNDAIDPDFLKTAMEFVDAGGLTDVNHDFEADGRIVFAWPLLPDVNEAMGIKSDVLGLAVAVKPSAETYKRFKAGELTGFSIAGIGERSPLVDKTTEREASTSKSTPRAMVPDVGIMETKIVVLTEAQHAHYAKLAPADGEAFLAKSSDERAALIAEIEKSNAVEYTAEDGTIYRKSDDPRLVDMAKRMDESIRIAKAESAAREAAQAQVEIEKRAETVFGKVAGERSLHAKILKAVDALGDEATQALQSMATLANERMTSLEVVAGIKPDAEVAASDNPQAEYDGLVADALKSFGGDRFKAAASVLKTARGAQLYTEIQKRAKARK